METKSIKIQVPEGYEIDKDNSTFEEIKFRPVIESFEKIMAQLGISTNVVTDSDEYNKNNRLHNKLWAIEKLMIIAKYLNKGWIPNWNNFEYKYKIYYDYTLKELRIYHNQLHLESQIYFKSEKLAQKAIDILGEETIKQALSDDY